MRRPLLLLHANQKGSSRSAITYLKVADLETLDYIPKFHWKWEFVGVILNISDSI